MPMPEGRLNRPSDVHHRQWRRENRKPQDRWGPHTNERYNFPSSVDVQESDVQWLDFVRESDSDAMFGTQIPDS